MRAARLLLILAMVQFQMVQPLISSAEDKEPATPEQLVPEEYRPGQCPVLCAQHQSCIAQRCVESCRPACRLGSYCAPDGSCHGHESSKKTRLTEEDRQRLAGAQSADSEVFVFLDVGGVVGFGVQPGLEWGKKHALVARVRLMNTGMMTHALFFQNEHLRFEWGFGASVAYRFYEAKWGNLRGFYYGGGLDYTVTRVSGRMNVLSDQELHGVAPFGEFGYRWVLGDFAIGFGPTLALRYPIATSFDTNGIGSCLEAQDCEEARERRFEGTVHIEIGWFQ